MRLNPRLCFLIASTLVCVLRPDLAWCEPRLQIPLPATCNLFTPDQPVSFDVALTGFNAGDGKLTASVHDYFGHEAWTTTQPFRVEDRKLAYVKLQVGKLGEGYFELMLTAKVEAAGAQTVERSQTVSFGVAPFIQRTAEQVRHDGYRFGLKIGGFGGSKSDIDVSTEDAVASCCNLGLQWTRDIVSARGTMGLIDIVQRYPMNVVVKVERFPKELYDTQRYGPMDQWETKFGKGAWTLKTLPQKEPYQQWLRTQLADIPADLNVFEIWNEAWDKMSPEDFATICQWIVPVILESRPNAIIGPNLLGETSPYQFDGRVIKAGGMKGMKMVALHPYGASEDRAWMRAYRQWLREQLGQDVDIYVTEFGSHSTPQGPAKRSEQEQAQRVVRQALSLYAEDVKAFMPHWMGQNEENPTYVEDWFGFFRLNRQPKPVLMAYATAARMVDGSRYVGDLWYGPGCDAMVFERSGTYTLALFTRGETKEITIDPGMPQVTLVNFVGAATPQSVPAKLVLTLGPDAQYVVGINPKLGEQATKQLRPDRWPMPAKPPRTARLAHRMSPPSTLDGKPEEWKATTQIALVNPKVNGDDCSGMAYLAWDPQNLYVAVDVRDNEILNTEPRAKLYLQDSLELFVSTEPRDKDSGYGPHDHQFFITPTSGEGKPIVAEVTDREAGKVVDVPGANFFAGKANKGWVAEVAIPWSAFGGFTPRDGAKLALDMCLNDADTSHPRFKLNPVDSDFKDADPTGWSYLTLQE